MTTSPEPDDSHLEEMAAAFLKAAQNRLSEDESDEPLSTPKPPNAELDKSLSVPKPLDASVAIFLDYLESFYESLENVLKDIERKEQSSNKSYDAQSEYLAIRVQYEGLYLCRVYFYIDAISHLMKLLYAIMHKGAPLKHEARLLTEDECRTLFQSFGVHAGFAITFCINFFDISSYFTNKEDYSVFDNSNRLIDFTRPLREQDWETLRAKAIKLVPDLVQDKINRPEQNLLNIFGYKRYYCFHPQIFASRELDKLASEIITAEITRFRRFMEAFQGTLRYLADTKPLAQMYIKSPIFDWEKREESLQAFRQTLHLLRAIGSGTLPSLPTIEANIVESSISADIPVELLQMDVAGAVLLLSTREAALVVHAASQLKGAQVDLTTEHGQRAVAYVVGRKVGEIAEYAAIFPRIPMFGATSMQVIITSNALQSLGNIKDMPVTVFAGNVTDAYLEG